MNKKIILKQCSLGFFSAVSILTFINNVNAQTVVSVGVQEVYDDNIFLENGDKITLPANSVDENGNPLVLPKQVDGEKQNDLITNAFIGASGAISYLEPYAKASTEAKLGTLIFADETDQSRLTFDGYLNLSSDKKFIPDPYYITLNNSIRSQASDITAAEGTSAKQAQTYIASLGLGVSNIKLAENTKFAAGYTLSYNDFLGDFTFNNNSEDDLGEFENRVKTRGSDYFLNAIDASVDHDITSKLSAGVYGNVNSYTYTKVETKFVEDDLEASDYDRDGFKTGVKSKYQISEQVFVDGSAGIDYNRFVNDPKGVTVLTLQGDGTVAPVEVVGEQDDLAFVFNSSVNYAPDKSSAIKLAIDQSRRTDVDGDKLITRNISLDASRSFDDRLKGSVGGRFLQYNIGDSLTNPTERYDLSASLQYALTEAIALVAGYNYTRQNADEQNRTQNLLYDTNDYTGNRVFLGISGGLVGKAN
ncbi:MAG: hypothetical protein KBC84_02795 [Proteobacteria bacterium]|nr:hypothetical protein [Pseudomonadota bacterium]